MTLARQSGVTLAGILHPDRNSFGVVRLAMAVAVLVSHSYFFVSGTSTTEPLHDITGHSLGEHAVQVFFFLSGILVMQSFIKSGSLVDFGTARALRIFPGLSVCVLLTALVIGPIVSNADAWTYFSSSALPSYIAKTLLLVTGSAPLPGVFTDAPASGLVNMSLWTLKYEALCYVMLGLACASGMMTGRHEGVSTTALAILVFGIFLNEPKSIEAYSAADNIRYFALYFGMGVLACQLRQRLAIHGTGVLVFFFMFVVMLGTCWSELTCALFLGYASLYVATIDFGWIGRSLQGSDLSFGVYIYAAPIQQALVQTFPGLRPLELAVAALVLTLGAANLSWGWIERTALARRTVVVTAFKGALRAAVESGAPRFRAST